MMMRITLHSHYVAYSVIPSQEQYLACVITTQLLINQE